MTDTDIIKALERVKQQYGTDCYACNFKRICRGKICPFHACDYALDLINRQKAEIEELEAEMDKQYEQARADILGNMSDGGTSCHWCIEQHKSEAIREFAERLKTLKIKPEFPWDDFYVTETDIDNLVKEMTEGEK